MANVDFFLCLFVWLFQVTFDTGILKCRLSRDKDLNQKRTQGMPARGLFRISEGVHSSHSARADRTQVRMRISKTNATSLKG